MPETTLLDISAIGEVAHAEGLAVDVLTLEGLPDKFRVAAPAEASLYKP